MPKSNLWKMAESAAKETFKRGPSKLSSKKALETAYTQAVDKFRTTGSKAALKSATKLGKQLIKVAGLGVSVGLLLATDLASPAEALTRKRWAEAEGPSPQRGTYKGTRGKAIKMLKGKK